MEDPHLHSHRNPQHIRKKPSVHTPGLSFHDHDGDCGLPIRPLYLSDRRPDTIISKEEHEIVVPYHAGLNTYNDLVHVSEEPVANLFRLTGLQSASTTCSSPTCVQIDEILLKASFPCR